MEMTLRLPSSYVEVDRDEMEYVDGGWWSKAEVKAAIFGAIGYGVTRIASKTVTASMIGSAMAYASGQLAFAVDTAILSALYSPWTIPVVAAALVTGVWAFGHYKLHRW